MTSGRGWCGQGPGPGREGGWLDCVGSGGEGRAVPHNLSSFPFSIHVMLRGAHTPSSAHSAPMGAEGFLSISFVGGAGAPPSFFRSLAVTYGRSTFGDERTDDKGETK